MAAMLSTDIKSNDREFSLGDREVLLDVAQSSIRFGLRAGRPPEVDPTLFADRLRTSRDTFVTLHIDAELRGCVGSVDARRPLVVDIAENAFNAAFRDPRFPPLRSSEFAMLTIHISILSPVKPLEFTSEAHLLEQIRPGTDGLEISYGPHRSLLLPSVWKDLPNKRKFLRTLKLKAGLPATFPSHRMNVNRFTAESFGRRVSSLPDNILGA